MPSNSPKFFGISGTLLAGLITFLASIRIENPILFSLVLLAFLFLPAFSCVVGGLEDYRIATMIVIYTFYRRFFLLE